jgi:hypothetical protein
MCKAKPKELLGKTTQLTFTSKSAAAWYRLTFPVPVKLAAGNYWIGIISGVSKRVAAESCEPVKNAEDYNTNTYISGPSNPFGQNDQRANVALPDLHAAGRLTGS